MCGSCEDSSATQGRMRNRFSYMGDGTGPLSHIIESISGMNTVKTYACIEGCKCRSSGASVIEHLCEGPLGVLRSGLNTFGEACQSMTFWKAKRVDTCRGCSSPSRPWQLVEVDGTASEARSNKDVIEQPSVNFPFRCGYVGYFSYEFHGKTLETMGVRVDKCSGIGSNCTEQEGTQEPPQAVWLFVDRFIAIDHHSGRLFVVWLSPLLPKKEGSSTENIKSMQSPKFSDRSTGGEKTDSVCIAQAMSLGKLTKEQQIAIAQHQEDWVYKMLEVISTCTVNGVKSVSSFSPLPELVGSPEGSRGSVLPATPPSGSASNTNDTWWGDNQSFKPVISKRDYVGAIEKIQDEIRQGNVYEACLTTQMRAEWNPQTVKPLAVYNALRNENGSDYGAYIRYYS